MKKLGREIKLYINDEPLNCEIQHSLQRTFEFLQKAGRQQALSYIRNQKIGTVSVTMFINFEAATSYKTIIQIAEAGAIETYSIWDGTVGSPRINFDGYIQSYEQSDPVDGLAVLEFQILIDGDLEVLIGGSYQATFGDTIDSIFVYSAEVGTVNYALRNTSTGITTTGTLTFVAPAQVGGVEDGWFRQSITGLMSGTKYELTVGLSTKIEVFTPFNIPNASQELFPIAEADYLTRTGLSTYGLPYTVEPIALDGTVNDFSGNTNHAQIKNSPCPSFANNATLTFIDATPYTIPAAVTVHAGTATGSYDSATGVFTIGASGAGTIEALEVDGNIVYLVSGTSNAYRWEKGNVQYLFFSSSATWTTTDNHAFLQARGGNMIKDVFFPNAQIALASNIVLAPLFKITYVATPYDLFLTNTFKQFEFGRQTTNTGFVFRLTSGNPQVQILTSVGNRTAGIPVGIKFNEQNTFIVERINVNTIVFTVTNSAGTGTVNVDISGGSGANLTSHNFAIENLLMRNGLSATVLKSYAFAKIDSIVIEQNGVVTNSYTPTSSNLDLGGSNNIGTYNKVNLNVPSALDASGNSTGFDIAGNALPSGSGRRFFDFGNLLEWKTGSPITDDYEDLPPPIVGTSEYGIEDTNNPKSKRAIMYYSSPASGAEDAEILKLFAAANDPTPKKIIR